MCQQPPAPGSSEMGPSTRLTRARYRRSYWPGSIPPPLPAYSMSRTGCSRSVSAIRRGLYVLRAFSRARPLSSKVLVALFLEPETGSMNSDLGTPPQYAKRFRLSKTSVPKFSNDISSTPYGSAKQISTGLTRQSRCRWRARGSVRRGSWASLPLALAGVRAELSVVQAVRARRGSCTRLPRAA